MRQIKFAKDILAKFCMEISNPVKSLHDPELKLTKAMCEERRLQACLHNDKRALPVGCLMYLMVGTRPDLGVLIQFAADPCLTHW